jgi:fumarate reductase flavoprotein subunit
MNLSMRDADSIVIGAGAAGLMGALAAAHRGARVLLLEKNLAGPSNLLVSGGLFPGAGTRWQREAGVEDSPGLFAQDIRAKAAGTANEAIVDAVARRSADAVQFLADEVGLPVQLTKITMSDHRALRLHATPGQSGRELHALLRAAAKKHPNIEIVDGVDLLAAGDLKAPSVLLATGGFAGNRALLEEFLPQVAGALHIGAGPNDGAAIVYGRRFGAAVAQMEGYQGQGHVNPGSKTRLGMALPTLGAFLVNREGKRFAPQKTGPSELAALVLAQPGGVALEVFDQRIHEIAMKQGPYREAWEAGAVMVAEDAAQLPVQVETEGLKPPFYASWVTGALAHTQGGLDVDARARVLRADGSAIEGLFAAGGAAAGLAGRGGEGYLPGNGLAQSFALGLIAGEEMSLRARA